jgi:hypothetical protein
MELESKFKPWINILTGLFILFTGLLIFSFSQLLSIEKIPSFGVLIFIGLLVFFWIWIFFGEIRTKAVKVSIEMNNIIVSQYLGLGRKKIFNLSEFDGFKISLLPSEYDTYEFLYLMMNDKKIVKLSEFYHRNYSELKTVLAKKVTYLGNEKLNILNELKEIFI